MTESLITADTARETIALLVQPQKSVEKIQAEKLVCDRESELQRKINEGKWFYKFTIEPNVLHGHASAHLYNYCRTDYHEELADIANEIIKCYKKRGFKASYSVRKLGYAQCLYYFVVDWEPIKNVDNIVNNETIIPVKMRATSCLIS